MSFSSETSPIRLRIDRRRLFRVVLVGLCIASGLGCGDDSEAPEMAPGRGVDDAEERRPSATEPVSGQVGPQPHAPGSPSAMAEEQANLRVPLEAVEATPITVMERREEEAEPQRVRDPSAELRTALGDPTSCLTEADRRIGRDISFQVEVDTLRSGMVVDARVEAPGVSDEAIECVRRRADGVRFAPFDERGPTVQTALILRLTPPEE